MTNEKMCSLFGLCPTSGVGCLKKEEEDCGTFLEHQQNIAELGGEIHKAIEERGQFSYTAPWFVKLEGRIKPLIGKTSFEKLVDKFVHSVTQASVTNEAGTQAGSNETVDILAN